MPGHAPQAAEGTGLSALVLDLQRQNETHYLSARLLEFDLARMRNRAPANLVKPAPARLSERLIPALARKREERILRDSGLFDPQWYLASYPDVRKAGADPARHFLRFGAQELRDPGPGFSTAHYLRLYPDVKATGLNPLIHYLTHGQDENRLALPAPRRT